jgi:hypothetical protein
MVDTWEMTPTQSSNMGTRFYPPGDYLIEARVFNQETDTEPSVEGYKTFTIVAEQTASAVVTCYPSGPIIVDEGASSGPYSLVLTWAGNWPYSFTAIGSELWFAATPTTGMTSFTASPGAGSAAELALAVFSSANDRVAWSSSVSGSSVETQVLTTAGQTYYMVVIDLGNSMAGSRSFSVAYDAYTITATPIEADGVYLFDSLAAGEARWYSIQGLQDHTYAINWDDSFRGSISAEADLLVSAYGQDLSVIFVDADSGWQGDYYYEYGTLHEQPVDGTRTVGPLAADELIYLKVRGYASVEYGAFGLKVTDLGL